MSLSRIFRSIALSLLALAAGSLLFLPFAFGQVAPDVPLEQPPGVNADLVTQLFNAVAHGDWPVAAGLALIVVVYVLMKFVKPRYPMFSTKLGGLSLTVVVAILGALGTALLGPGVHAISGALVWTAVKIGFCSGGGYALVKGVLDEHVPWLHEVLFPPASLPVVGSAVKP